jgi:hypothetical protein
VSSADFALPLATCATTCLEMPFWNLNQSVGQSVDRGARSAARVSARPWGSPCASPGPCSAGSTPS